MGLIVLYYIQDYISVEVRYITMEDVSTLYEKIHKLESVVRDLEEQVAWLQSELESERMETDYWRDRATELDSF